MAGSELLKRVRSHGQLERAWRVIEENGRSSKSEDVRREIEAFREKASANLRSISGRLSRSTYRFPAARGIPVPKGDKKDRSKFRPIVLGTVEARVVQRAILDALTTVEPLQPFFQNPYSFGGIRKTSDGGLAAVPAAIGAVLGAIGGGACFVVCADISSFFTRISKSEVSAIIASVVQDPAFMALFADAIHVELANMAELRERAGKFPIGDIGVAQGNSLSPLLGNVVLHGFDRAMNEGDCRCIRYIDDFIILAPTRAAALARLKRAKALLGEHGMVLAEEKTHKEPRPVTSGFEFLGIDLNNGLIRPCEKARANLLASLKQTFEASQAAFVAQRRGEALPKAQSLLSTLKHVDGIVQGWGKHYRFCNDAATLQALDAKISAMIRTYVGAYADQRTRLDDSARRALLGIELLEGIPRTPFVWPKRRFGPELEAANAIGT